MVWFQCEDCGENLKKPKLPGHFRICSAFKFSCIDCGQTFSQQSVQGHTQCISEAEKYGPKGQARATPNIQKETTKAKQYPDVDIYVGLSSHAPWLCSLCNTNTTSKQTLMLHAEGKKHRAKARAFHAAQKQSTETVAPSSNEEKNVTDDSTVGSDQVNGSIKADNMKELDALKGEDNLAVAVKDDNLIKKKRKHDASNGELHDTNTTESKACNLSNGDVVHAEQREPQCEPKKRKSMDVKQQGENYADKHRNNPEASQQKIKLKKLVVAALKEQPDGVMKIKKLQRQVTKSLKESGDTEDKEQLCNRLMDKINSSSRFMVDNKHVRLVAKK